MILFDAALLIFTVGGMRSNRAFQSERSLAPLTREHPTAGKTNNKGDGTRALPHTV